MGGNPWPGPSCLYNPKERFMDDTTPTGSQSARGRKVVPPASRANGGDPETASPHPDPIGDNPATPEPEAAAAPPTSTAGNGADEGGHPDLMAEAVAPEDAAAAPLDDLMAEALGSPEEYGALAPSPTAFSIRKPGLDEWFRVHSDFRPDFHFYQPTVKNRRDHVYLVRRAFAPLFGDAARAATLRLCINSQGDAFVWMHPVSTSGAGASWARSRAEIAGEAVKGWITITSGDGCYNSKPPINPSVFDEPVWPSGTFNEWVHRAFPPALQVNSIDHPAVEYHQGKRKTL
jgi:hypothetical protein